MKNKTSKSNNTTRTTLPLGFQPIQESCASYRGELNLLAHTNSKYNAAVTALMTEFLPAFQKRAESIRDVRVTLSGLINNNRPLFASPKTRIFSDIKVGLRKLEGETIIADPDKTLELIEKHFPDRLDELAPRGERVLRKDALKNLTGAELKKIAVQITADTDAIIIKPQDTDVEKAVAALLKETAQT
jgi:hypothetical protein